MHLICTDCGVWLGQLEPSNHRDWSDAIWRRPHIGEVAGQQVPYTSGANLPTAQRTVTTFAGETRQYDLAQSPLRVGT